MKEKKQQVKRKHNFPDSELYSKGISALRVVAKHLDDFEAIGYTKHDAGMLKRELDAFIAIPTDEDYLGKQMVLTDKKHEAVRNLVAAIREAMNLVARVYDPKSGQYRRFGTLRLGDQSAEKLLFIARNMVRVSENYWPALERGGVTQRHLDRIRERTAELQSAMMWQVDAISERDCAADSRILQSNVVYDELARLCEAGQSLFKGSPVLYELFTLYDSNAEAKIAAKNAKGTGEAASGPTHGAPDSTTAPTGRPGTQA